MGLTAIIHDTTLMAGGAEDCLVANVEGKAYADDLLLWDRTALHIKKPFYVGSAKTTNSTDPMINVYRQVSAEYAGNGHCFSDSSNLIRAGGISYCSFDARITVTGANSYGHYAAFQVGPVFNLAGTIADHYGVYHGPIVTAGTILEDAGLTYAPINNGGTITTAYGVRVLNISGAGAVTNQYGLYVHTLTKGATLNYAIYTEGATMSYLGGCVGMGALPAAHTPLHVGGTVTAATGYGIKNNVTYQGNGVGFDSQFYTSGSANISLIIGLQLRNEHNSSGTLANSYGVYATSLGTGGTTTNRYAMYVTNHGGAGAVTNQYGVYIAALTAGTTLNYAIYTAGSTPSYFEGPVGFGTTPGAGYPILVGGAYSAGTNYGIVNGVTGTGSLVGFDATGWTTGSGNVSALMGIQLRMQHKSSGTLTNRYGVLYQPSGTGGLSTNSYGVYVFDMTGAGGLTNQYGVYVQSLTKGATINYAIYTDGATRSYFGGSVGFGAVPSEVYSIFMGGTKAQATHYGFANECLNTGNVVGFDCGGGTTGSDNVTSMIGAQIHQTHASSGTLTNHYGLYCSSINSGGVVSNRYGVYVAETTGAGSLTAQYGIYVAELTKAASGNFAIYTAGESLVRFTGNMAVGTNPGAGYSILAGGTKTEATNYGISNAVLATGSAVGFDCQGGTTGSANIGNIIGLQTRGNHGSSGTLTAYYSVYAAASSSGGTTTNRFGLYVADMTGAGDVTTQTGVYIATLSKATTNYAIFTLGLTKSHFEGPLELLNVAAQTVPTNCCHLYSWDAAAGNACVHAKTEAGQIIKLYQQAKINAPSGGATQDAEARSAIGSILTLLSNNGLMAAA
jgi:hypothetical protein